MIGMNCDQVYRVAQKKVYTCVLQTLTSHKSHFLLIFDGKTYINEKVIHKRVYFSVCPPTSSSGLEEELETSVENTL